MFKINLTWRVKQTYASQSETKCSESCTGEVNWEVCELAHHSVIHIILIPLTFSAESASLANLQRIGDRKLWDMVKNITEQKIEVFCCCFLVWFIV